MEMPSDEQIAEAIADGLARRETFEQLWQRVEGLCRLSDAELAAMGIFPGQVDQGHTPIEGNGLLPRGREA